MEKSWYPGKLLRQIVEKPLSGQVRNIKVKYENAKYYLYLAIESLDTGLPEARDDALYYIRKAAEWLKE